MGYAGCSFSNVNSRREPGKEGAEREQMGWNQNQIQDKLLMVNRVSHPHGSQTWHFLPSLLARPSLGTPCALVHSSRNRFLVLLRGRSNRSHFPRYKLCAFQWNTPEPGRDSASREMITATINNRIHLHPPPSTLPTGTEGLCQSHVRILKITSH